MATRTLQIVLAGDAASASRSFRRVEQDAGRMGKALDREGRRVGGFATVTSKGFSRVGVASSAMSAVAGGAFALMAKNAVSAASDINESLSKNEQLFGKHAATIDKWSKTTARSLGISRREALESAGAFGSLFETIGVADRPAAQMSKRFVQLSADLASFHNATPTEALEALRSGLVGEAEPMRRFGALLSESRVKAEAYASGIAKVGKELTEQQKVQARYQLILEDTRSSHGDAARTGEQFAGQMRRLRAQVSDVAAQIGTALIPHVLNAVDALNNLIEETRNGRGPLIRLKNAVTGVVDEIKDAVGWFRRHKTTSDILLSTITGLTAAFVAYKVAVIAATIATRGMATAAVLLNLALRANPIGIVVTAVIALGAALVTAYHRSETFRKIVDKAFDGARRGARVAVGVFNSLLLPAFRAITSAADKVWNAMKKVGGVLGSIGGAAKSAAGGFGLFGDGLGKQADSINSITQFGGGLKGARPEMAPIAGLASRFGLGVSSGLRPGAITSSGRQSWHATGEALDVAGPPSAMMGFARFMSKRAGGLAELIYTPLGAWSNGSRYTPTGKLAADHYDHVHVAMDVGAPGQGDGIGRAVNAARSVGLSGRMLETMVAIAGAESGYDPKINAAGPEDSRGLWQINVGPGANTDMLRLGNLYDPMVNAKAMKIILGRQGLGAWSVYSSGKYRDYLTRARTAIAGTRRGGAGGGGGGGGGGGPSVDGPSARGETPTGPGVRLGMAGQLAQTDVREARAQKSDNLAKLISARKARRRILEARLKLVTKALKGKMRKARRVRLLGEQAQLIEEIDALNESISEYEADRDVGGATTISRAEELEAGKDPNAEPPPPPPDNSAAIAELTAAIDRMTRMNKWLIDNQGPTLVGAVLAAVNGGLGGPVGLGMQGIRSAPGSVAGL